MQGLEPRRPDEARVSDRLQTLHPTPDLNRPHETKLRLIERRQAFARFKAIL